MLRKNQTGIIGVLILVIIVIIFVIFVIQRAFGANSNQQTGSSLNTDYSQQQA